MSGPTPVVFNYSTWVTTFPEFSGVSSAQAALYFNIATLYFNNCGWTAGLSIAPTLLNLLTAHIAWLLAPRDANGNPASTGQPASPLVGRISSAGEGSVNVAVELEPSGSPSQDFFTQTKYGFMFWQATAQFRTAHYVPPAVPIGLQVGNPYPYPPYGRLVY